MGLRVITRNPKKIGGIMEDILKKRSNAWGFFVVFLIWTILLMFGVASTIVNFKVAWLKNIGGSSLVLNPIFFMFLFYLAKHYSAWIAWTGLTTTMMGYTLSRFIVSGGPSPLNLISPSDKYFSARYLLMCGYIFFAISLIHHKSNLLKAAGWSMVINLIIECFDFSANISGTFFTIINSLSQLVHLMVPVFILSYIATEGKLFRKTGAAGIETTSYKQEI